MAPLPERMATIRSQSSSCRAVTNAPATTSLWPLRYFVAECMTMSAPSSIGRVRIGVATVLSTARHAPARWAISAVAAMSVIGHVGLAGLSIQTSLVRPGCTAVASASIELASTKSTTIPPSAARLFNQLRRPQYMTCGATTWSPGRSARNTAVAAAIPDAKVRQAAPPSRLASSASGCTNVGLVGRP
jgi:hypothetical protein